MFYFCVVVAVVCVLGAIQETLKKDILRGLSFLLVGLIFAAGAAGIHQSEKEKPTTQQKTPGN